MENKTAMMELIEQLNSHIYSVSKETILDRGYGEGLVYCRNLAEQLLEKEKEQIMEAFDEGGYLHDSWHISSEDYYNETYLENKTNGK